ncbi:hypothetical protein R3P38DRAFT_3042941 [Favolaschia claudopus]|uniref:Uncharacterized protein n=1 Tax=Favolaschia claudopus TaxID=2862362 RepID=A0AAW0A8B6_9AGAR
MMDMFEVYLGYKYISSATKGKILEHLCTRLHALGVKPCFYTTEMIYVHSPTLVEWLQSNSNAWKHSVKLLMHDIAFEKLQSSWGTNGTQNVSEVLNYLRFKFLQPPVRKWIISKLCQQTDLYQQIHSHLFSDQDCNVLTQSLLAFMGVEEAISLDLNDITSVFEAYVGCKDISSATKAKLSEHLCTRLEALEVENCFHAAEVMYQHSPTLMKLLQLEGFWEGPLRQTPHDIAFAKLQSSWGINGTQNISEAVNYLRFGFLRPRVRKWIIGMLSQQTDVWQQIRSHLLSNQDCDVLTQSLLAFMGDEVAISLDSIGITSVIEAYVGYKDISSATKTKILECLCTRLQALEVESCFHMTQMISVHSSALMEWLLFNQSNSTPWKDSVKLLLHDIAFKKLQSSWSANGTLDVFAIVNYLRFKFLQPTALAWIMQKLFQQICLHPLPDQDCKLLIRTLLRLQVIGGDGTISLASKDIALVEFWKCAVNTSRDVCWVLNVLLSTFAGAPPDTCSLIVKKIGLQIPLLSDPDLVKVITCCFPFPELPDSSDDWKYLSKAICLRLSSKKCSPHAQVKVWNIIVSYIGHNYSLTTRILDMIKLVQVPDHFLQVAILKAVAWHNVIPKLRNRLSRKQMCDILIFLGHPEIASEEILLRI